MATPDEVKKQIEDINDNLNNTIDRITSVGKSLNDSIIKQLTKATEKTRELADGLLKSKDINKDISKINAEIVKSNTKNVEISIKKSIAEQAYT